MAGIRSIFIAIALLTSVVSIFPVMGKQQKHQSKPSGHNQFSDPVRNNIVMYLLKNGANVKDVDQRGRSARDWAAHHSRDLTVAILSNFQE